MSEERVLAVRTIGSVARKLRERAVMIEAVKAELDQQFIKELRGLFQIDRDRDDDEISISIDDIVNYSVLLSIEIRKHFERCDKEDRILAQNMDVSIGEFLEGTANG